MGLTESHKPFRSSFLWLVAEEEVRENASLKRIQHALAVLKMMEAVWGGEG